MSTRQASHAGTWYSSHSGTLSSSLAKWLDIAQEADPLKGSESFRVRAIIAPHAGYSYSGPTAAFAYAPITAEVDSIATVFVLGPSHHVYLDSCALSSCSQFATPLGDIEADADVVAELKATGQFGEMDLSVDEDEHSIEMHLPYIRKIMDAKTNGVFRIVPILVGTLSAAKQALYGRILSPYLANPSCLFVVSSDFCHWGTRFRYTPQPSLSGAKVNTIPIYEHIAQIDREGMCLIERIDVQGFTAYLQRTKNTICGRMPICLLLQTIAAIDMRGSRDVAASAPESAGALADASPAFKIQFVKYAQSGQVLTIGDSSVSYASGICYSAS
ncbi:hypothetical protein BC830DRAFT_1123850 [Chytriomyces sp. MP71]|nr:hypothetical protein BC830DRAFT_1123850 [Chytriomyces sp. MP71]